MGGGLWRVPSSDDMWVGVLFWQKQKSQGGRGVEEKGLLVQKKGNVGLRSSIACRG